MPRIFKPKACTDGPGSALAAQNPFAKKQKRRPKRSKDATPSQRASLNAAAARSRSFIGESLLDWVADDDDDDEENETASSKENSSMNDHHSLRATNRNHSTSAAKASTTHQHQQAATTRAEARRALGFDTRCLQSKSALGMDICREFRSFARTLGNRGIGARLVAMTVPSRSKIGTATVGIQFADADKMMQGSDINELKPIAFSPEDGQPLQHVLFVKPDHEVDTVIAPKSLGAKYSWKILGEMVNTIVMENQRLNSWNKKQATPLDITLMTTDLALFCDTSEAAHKKAVTGFLDRVVDRFQSEEVVSINLVVAETGKLALVANGTNGFDDLSSMHTNQSIAMARCIHAIQHELTSRSQAEFQQASWDLHAAHPVNLTLTAINHCSMGYQSLARKLVRNSLIGRSLQARLLMDLPELSDGTKCSLSLDGNYQTLPFAIDCPSTDRLAKDLLLLGGNKLEIVQAIPHTSVDSSLIYGVPIKIRPGLEADFESTQQIEALTRSLFRYLDRENMVLLLSASSTAEFSPDEVLFHTAGDNTFILMPQELPKSTLQEPHSGIMFRYARVDDLLLEATMPTTAAFLDFEMESQFADYIDRAMDAVIVMPDNPLDPKPVRHSTTPISTGKGNDKSLDSTVDTALPDVNEGSEESSPGDPVVGSQHKLNDKDEEEEKENIALFD